jgi:hypothetical protein
MSDKSSGHQPIHFLPEFVCEAIPAPGLSLPPRRDLDHDVREGSKSDADAADPDKPTKPQSADPKSKEPEGTI